MPSPKPFKLDISSNELDWITDRIKTARLVPDITHPPTQEWEHGVPTAIMVDYVNYWKEKYGWKRTEAKINETYKMFSVDLEEAGQVISLHFVHHRSRREDAVPLLFVHGNFTEVESLLALTDPEDPKRQAFHIVAPSLPGFAFSSPPTKPGFGAPQIASLFNQLMLTLGYQQYIGQGGDWGSFILRRMAFHYPASCVGIHLNYVIAFPPSPFQHPITLFYIISGWFTQDQKARLARLNWWMEKESGYRHIQQTKPQTLCYGLNDSPIGMLAWILDKLTPLADKNYVWDKDLVITWTMLYLLSGNAGHARLYTEVDQEVFSLKIPRQVAVGFSAFPSDVGYIPKWWADAVVAEDIVFWKEHDKGGHFASVECGDALVEDVQSFVGLIREKGDPKRYEALIAH
ncbi:hypothetical protein VKT23_001289 [Stygiomarasmius scandens]|uniref:Epoxide hydrolase N-terminal domain-containing protein n=1 Tax=Marasmiellus scandens TaxID=2682957 RepID=A0ABR1K6M6_9AGAR